MMRLALVIGVGVACLALPGLIPCGATGSDGFTTRFAEDRDVAGVATVEKEPSSIDLDSQDGADGGKVVESIPLALLDASEPQSVRVRGVKTLVTGLLLVIAFLAMMLCRSGTTSLQEIVHDHLEKAFGTGVAEAIAPVPPIINLAFLYLGFVFTLLGSGLFELGMSLYNKAAARRKGKPAPKYPIRGVTFMLIAAVLLGVSLYKSSKGKRKIGIFGDGYLSMGIGMGTMGLGLLLYSLIRRLLHKPRRDNSKTGTQPFYREGDNLAIGAASEHWVEADDVAPLDVVGAVGTRDVADQGFTVGGVEDGDNSDSPRSSYMDSDAPRQEDIEFTLENT